MILLSVSVGVLWLSISGYNFLSGRKLIRDFFHYAILEKKTLKEWDHFCNTNHNKSDIIISLTTIPSRIHQIQATLKSLLSQSVSPKAIHIYLPLFSEREKKPYEIPHWLLSLSKVKTIPIATDWGPSTKFIPAIQMLEPNQKILVVDDDNIYPRTNLKAFVSAERKQADLILAASGWRVPGDLIDKPTTLYSNIFRIPPTPVLATRIGKTYPIDVVQGYSGYLIKPRFFDLEELTAYDAAPPAARFVDDVWISAHSKVKKLVIPMKRLSYSVFWKQKFYKSTSLAKINNWNRERNEDRNNSIMIKYFKDKWNHVPHER